MWVFLDSNFFQTFMMLIVGLFVFAVYKIQQYDEKVKSAQIIIMEIRDIEQSITNIMKIPEYYNTKPIITTNSWEKYKYLFINELDQDEYKLINDFYVNACRIEEERFVIRQQICLTFTEKTRLLQEKIADQTDKFIGKPDEYLKAAREIAELINNDNPVFQGQMPKQLLQKIAHECKPVTVTTAGSKLKEIASTKRKIRFRL